MTVILLIIVGLVALCGGICIGAVLSAMGAAPHLVEMEDSYQPIDTPDYFTGACKPLMKYLSEKHHPHTTVIVTNTNAQLLEGVTTTGEITEFLKD